MNAGGKTVESRFEVYGRLIAVKRMETGWKCFLLGPEGKRRPVADIVIPEFVAEDEIAQYLADILHECATPNNGDPRRIL